MPDSRLHSDILENLKTPVLLLDASQKIHYVNTEAEKFLGVSASRLLGTDLKHWLIEAVTKEEWAKLLRATRGAYKYDVNMGPKGEYDIVISMLETGSQLSPLWLLELHPVTHQKRIQEASQHQDLLDQVKWLGKGLAHEIKNPLSGIRGAAQLLEKELLSDDQKAFTGVIIKEVDRLKELLNRLQVPSRQTTRQHLNIHEVLERVRLLLEAEKATGIIIQRDYDPSLPTLMADETQLIQVFLNLGRNALSALEKKGRVIFRTRLEQQVTIGTDFTQKAIRVEVIDDGPGVSESLKDHLFYPFVTTKAEGTGLGLSISQSIIQQHAGVIRCETRPGKTVFSVLLPLEHSYDKFQDSLDHR